MKNDRMLNRRFFLCCLIIGFFLLSSQAPAGDSGLCRIDLRSLSRTSGSPGDTFEMYGVWGEEQGAITPSINKGGSNRLEVLSWSNTVIRVKIPEHLPSGLYKVGAYCNNPPHWQGTTWKNFRVTAKGNAVGGNRPAPGDTQPVNTTPAVEETVPAPADERILSFVSDITVHGDSSMTVAETITVRVRGDKIKRGIYRDFPTTYKDVHGNRFTVGFSVIGVLKNGHREPYHEEGLSNGKRVYIGDKNTYLRPGEYAYVITYKTDRQIGFFRDHDELYWNVTGNGWEFPIDAASAFVTLPEGVAGNVTSTEGYTGFQGEKGRDYSEGIDESGAVGFRTTRSLRAHEGLTIVVSWPKGYVREPDTRQKALYILRDKAGTVLPIAGLLVIIMFYLSVWSAVGKDPAPGTIVTRYTPPENMSPAVMRYMTKMGYDDRTLSAAIINMAVKGHLTIKEDDDTFTLVRKAGGVAPLSAEEQGIMKTLLGGSGSITLKTTNRSTVRSAVKAFRDYLAAKYERIYFVTNRRYFLTGLALTVAVLVISGMWQAGYKGRLPIFLFMCVWLSFWTVAVLGLANQVAVKWRHAIRGRGISIAGAAGAIFITLFSLPFFAGEIAGLSVLGYATSLETIVFLIAAGLTNHLFYHYLKAPTRAGRTLLDAIEGFRRFLDATEKDRMNMLNPPERTPDLFERYLPYALALGLEQKWAENFSDVLSSSGKAESGAYSPAWFSGTSFSGMTGGDFASTFSDSFSGAISSSTAAPGSGSGGGGGGSSGGGGGGGGGGGW